MSLLSNLNSADISRRQLMSVYQLNNIKANQSSQNDENINISGQALFKLLLSNKKLLRF